MLSMITRVQTSLIEKEGQGEMAIDFGEPG
jgi:hypothetical protein